MPYNWVAQRHSNFCHKVSSEQVAIVIWPVAIFGTRCTVNSDLLLLHIVSWLLKYRNKYIRWPDLAQPIPFCTLHVTFSLIESFLFKVYFLVHKIQYKWKIKCSPQEKKDTFYYSQNTDQSWVDHENVKFHCNFTEIIQNAKKWTHTEKTNQENIYPTQNTQTN